MPPAQAETIAAALARAGCPARARPVSGRGPRLSARRERRSARSRRSSGSTGVCSASRWTRRRAPRSRSGDGRGGRAALDRPFRALLRDQPVSGHGLQPVSPPAGLSPRSRGGRRPDRRHLEPHRAGRGGAPPAGRARHGPLRAAPGHPVGRRAPRARDLALPRGRSPRPAALQRARAARLCGGAPVLGALRLRRRPRARAPPHRGPRAVRGVGHAADLDRRLDRRRLAPALTASARSSRSRRSSR